MRSSTKYPATLSCNYKRNNIRTITSHPFRFFFLFVVTMVIVMVRSSSFEKVIISVLIPRNVFILFVMLRMLRILIFTSVKIVDIFLAVPHAILVVPVICFSLKRTLVPARIIIYSYKNTTIRRIRMWPNHTYTTVGLSLGIWRDSG